MLTWVSAHCLIFPELAARITPLQDGQTTDLVSVRDGVHVLKLERKQNEQKL